MNLVCSVESMSLFLFCVVVAVLGEDRYSESVESIPITSNLSLYSFRFQIETKSNSSRLLDLFPQSVASVLIANRETVESLTGRLVRGRWKWDPSLSPPPGPTGSSMFLRLTEATPLTARLWTQTAWLFSSIFAGSFESLSPEQKSFSWITPMDLEGNVRVGFNPNEPVCTDNLSRIVELLPCRSRAGLGKAILDLSIPMARSEYISISLEPRNKESSSILDGRVDVVLASDSVVSIESCSAADSLLPLPSPRKSNPVRVFRSLTGSEMGPERRYGKLVISLQNTDEFKPHSIEVVEQLPYFLVPLWHSLSGPSPDKIRWSDASTDSPTYIRWTVRLSPGETIHILLDVYKRFIPMPKFSYSFEKGFDVGSAAYRIDSTGEWFLTRGLVVIIPLPDQTSTFNAIAVAVTPIGLFFGIIFRSFLDKRSEILDDKTSNDRDPPLFRLLRWIASKLLRTRPAATV